MRAVSKSAHCLHGEWFGLATCEWPCFTSTHSYSLPGRDSQIQTLLSRLQVASKEPVSTSRAAVRAEPSRLVSVQQRPSEYQQSCIPGHFKRLYFATMASKDSAKEYVQRCSPCYHACLTSTSRASVHHEPSRHVPAAAKMLFQQAELQMLAAPLGLASRTTTAKTLSSRQSCSSGHTDRVCVGHGSSQQRGQISLLQRLCGSCSHCYDSCILAVYSPSTRHAGVPCNTHALL